MKIEKGILVFGFASTVAGMISFIYAFMIAYFNPTKSVIIYIDLLHEATLEFFIILVAIPCLVYLFYKCLEDLLGN